MNGIFKKNGSLINPREKYSDAPGERWHISASAPAAGIPVAKSHSLVMELPENEINQNGGSGDAPLCAASPTGGERGSHS